jgi:uracil-DNA glycosylase
VLRTSTTARILVAGQAPGTKVHASGIPWDDRSGERLRAWLGLDAATFYDESLVAIVPMGFCYPGKAGSGDAPPRPECAKTWHPRLIPLMPRIALTLAIGRYAQRHFLGADAGDDLTATVRDADPAAAVIPLPHPSPRNVAWFVRNPWFERERLPALRARVAAIAG